MKLQATIFLSILFLVSCDKRKLNEKIFTNKDITLSWFQVSEITTMHDFVEVTRGNQTKKIMESNTDGIYDILIDGENITIKTIPDLVIYDFAAKTLNCNINHDKSVTTYEYLKKYRPESAEAFKSR